MELHDRELLVHRIISGCLRLRVHDEAGKVITVIHRNPTREQRYIAQELYQDTLEEALSEGCYGDDDLLLFLLQNGLWSEEETALLSRYEKDIQDFKMALYKNMFRQAERQAIRKYLDQAKKRRDDLFSRRHAFDHLTAHGTANLARSRYLIGCSLFLVNGKSVVSPTVFFPGGPEPGDVIFDNAVAAFIMARLDEDVIRELARTDPWRTIWANAAQCESLLGQPSSDLTEEQQRLVSWTSLYEKVEGHPDCPARSVFEDNDLFDGWMLLQKEEHDQQTNKAMAEKAIGKDKHGDADEVFILADSIEDARQIEELNDEVSKQTKKQRHSYISKRGQVNEGDMPDTRLKLQMQFAEMQRKNA